jgi:hypothetical protein
LDGIHLRKIILPFMVLLYLKKKKNKQKELLVFLKIKDFIYLQRL